MNMIPNNAHAAACFIEYRLAMIPRARSFDELEQLEYSAAEDLEYMLDHDLIGHSELQMHRMAINQALRLKRCELAPRRATA